MYVFLKKTQHGPFVLHTIRYKKASPETANTLDQIYCSILHPYLTGIKGDPGNTKLSLIQNVKNHSINFAYNVSVKVLIRNKTGIICKSKSLQQRTMD